MKQIFNIMEGTFIGFLVSGWLVIIGETISGTFIGIAITVILSTLIGGVVNRFSGAFAGLIAGGSAILLGNMVSQTSFGIWTTLLAGALLGGLVAWEISHQMKSAKASSGQIAR
jgi:hypothetical protein